MNKKILKDKLFYFLGSSVTFGDDGISMVECIAQRNNYVCVKEAVSGTTLADINEQSYVKRLCNLNKSYKIDGFICQLSTNDTRVINKGNVSASFDINSFDKNTTFGAIEYIIAYVKKTWNCPIYFYTNSFFDNNDYANMVETLYTIAKKWDIVVIDLFNDKKFNDISEKQRRVFMKDSIHPSKIGYKDWWTPKFEEYLLK